MLPRGSRWSRLASSRGTCSRPLARALAPEPARGGRRECRLGGRWGGRLLLRGGRRLGWGPKEHVLVRIGGLREARPCWLPKRLRRGGRGRVGPGLMVPLLAI